MADEHNYICSKCGKSGFYAGKKAKYIHTKCENCHKPIYLAKLIESGVHSGTNFSFPTIKVSTNFFEIIKKKGYYWKLQPEPIGAKPKIKDTTMVPNPKSAKPKTRQTTIKAPIGAKESKPTDPMVPKSNSAENANPQKSSQAPTSDNKNSWRAHLFRWKISLKSMKNGIQFEKTNDMGSFKANYLTIENCIVEVHTNCKEPNVVINIDESVYMKTPDLNKKATIEICLKILGKLASLGIDCDYDTIERLQSNHNAHSLENTQYANISNGFAKNELGSVHIDQSEGKPEIELIDAQLFKNGNGLCQAIVDTPKQMLRMQKLSEQTIESLNMLIKILSAIFTPKEQPIEEKKERSSDDLYA